MRIYNTFLIKLGQNICMCSFTKANPSVVVHSNLVKKQYNNSKCYFKAMLKIVIKQEAILVFRPPFPSVKLKNVTPSGSPQALSHRDAPPSVISIFSEFHLLLKPVWQETQGRACHLPRLTTAQHQREWNDTPEISDCCHTGRFSLVQNQAQRLRLSTWLNRGPGQRQSKDLLEKTKIAGSLLANWSSNRLDK